MSRNRLWLILPVLLAGSPVAAEDPAEIEKRIRQHLMKRSGDTDARFELARALARQNKFSAATREYTRLLKKYPDNPDYLLGMAQVKLWSGQPQEALPYLAQARQLAPGYADVWRVEIQALMALGGDVKARTIRDMARQKFPAEDWVFAQLETAVALPSVTSAKREAEENPVSAHATDSTSTLISPLTVAASPIPVPATPAAYRQTELEVGVSHERLTGGLPAWRSRYVLGEHRKANDETFYGGLRETDRYKLIDREAHVGIGVRLTSEMRLQVEAGASSTHRILPSKYGVVQFQLQPTASWTLTGGWRRSAYDLGMTSVVHLSADRYFGNERLSYTLYSGGPDGSGKVPSHRLQWAHYYGERSWVGISFNTGRETESLGTSNFLTSRVQGLNLAGRHRLDGNWALTWEAGRVRQGDAYTRSGARLGLRYSF